MDKLKAISKALLFGLIMLAFLALSALLAKLLKLSPARTYVFQGGMMLISTLVPLLYFAKKNYSCGDFGLNKPTKKSFKAILFYIPFIICMIPFAISFKKTMGTKMLIVVLFYYGCLAVAAEVYFRGVIQNELRGKMPILACAFFAGILFGLCNMHYLNHIMSIKRNIILALGSIGFGGCAYMAIENKGNILFLIILNALYHFIASNFIKSGKTLLIAMAISCVLFLIYGIVMVIIYKKNNKVVKYEEFRESENIDLTNDHE